MLTVTSCTAAAGLPALPRCTASPSCCWNVGPATMLPGAPQLMMDETSPDDDGGALAGHLTHAVTLAAEALPAGSACASASFEAGDTAR